MGMAISGLLITIGQGPDQLNTELLGGTLNVFSSTIPHGRFSQEPVTPLIRSETQFRRSTS
jgi:hypothetical protein